MAASPYSSTEEQTNACRACRLLLGPCTDQFRDVLRHFVQPPSFQQVILRKTNTLPRLTATQMNLILPRRSSYTGNYSDMDISLLYILLRNICSIPPHSTGWGNAPDPADRSLSASIERIHTARYQCVVSSSSVLSDADFNTIWSTVRSAVVDIDSFLNNGNHYKSQVDVLRQETIDPVGDQHFIEELKKQIHENEPTKEILHDLQNKIEKRGADRVEKQNEMQRIVDEIKTPKSVIPPNVKDNHEKQIQQWVEEDKVFSKTHNFEEMLDKVRERPYLTFVGIPGSGKSATIQHISLILQKEGYEIVPIINIRKIEDYCDSLKPQVFVIDDVVGVLGLQKQKLNLLMEYEIQISNPSNKDTKVLMSCRETVFNECHSYKSFLTHEKTAVMLHSSENSLTVDDKKRILLKHGLDDKLLPDSLLRDTSGMFPLLCKLYSKEEKFRNNVERFFTCPVECILEELDKMQHQNKLYYATLVLCMFNDKKLSKEILKNTENTVFHDMKSDVLEKCEVESYTDAYKFDNALKAMEGTYMHLRGNEYNFIHDSVFEIIAYHFGSQYPNLILQYISSSYVANKVKIQKCKKYEIGFGNKQAFESKSTDRESKPEEENGSVSSEISNDKAFNDLCIRLKEKQYPMLAERLFKDVKNLELYDVFMNKILKESKVCRFFIEVLKTKSYTELKLLFLSTQKDVSMVVSKAGRVRRDGLECMETNVWSKEWRIQEVLLNGKNVRKLTESVFSIRVISWVVYYGHSQIFRYILKQTQLHDETKSELFWICFNTGVCYVAKQGKEKIETKTDADDLCLLKSLSGSRNQKQDNNQSISEQYRLLVLSCFSGDLETFRMIIKHINRSIVNTELRYLDDGIWIFTPLIAACSSGHESIVKELLELGADVNLQGKFDTPLIAACEGGHIQVVKELLEARADVISNKYKSPLTVACIGGHISVVKELLKACAADISESEYDESLIAACESGHMSVVKELLKAGADVNIQDTGYSHTPLSPLSASCENGHVSIVKELLETGADVNLQGQDNIYAPLTAACKSGHLCVVKELLEAGANVNPQGQGNFDTPLIVACEGGHMNVVMELLEAGSDVNRQGQSNTPLTAACKGGNVILVKDLLKAGADVNIQGPFDTPLRAACKNGHMTVVKELLGVGAEINPQNKFDTPLTEACKGGHTSIVKELLKAGADVNIQDCEQTPLIVACVNGHVNVVKELLEAGTDVNIHGNYDTPLTAALKGGHINVVKKLLKAKADVNLRCKNDSPLTAACGGGHINALKILLEAGADVNLGGEYNTPLSKGCLGGHLSVVKELLRAGADVNLRNTHNTPLTAACWSGQMSIVKDLLEAGADVNIQDSEGKTPLYIIVLNSTETSLPIERIVDRYGADPTICDIEGVSAMYIALLRNKIGIVKQLLQTENESNDYRLKLHFFDCFVQIRHGEVMTDSKDDVVVRQRRPWPIKYGGILYDTIIVGKYQELKHLLCVGLEVNQWIQLYDCDYKYSFEVRPLLFTLIDQGFNEFIRSEDVDGVERIKIILEAGVDVNVRVTYIDSDSELDRVAVFYESSEEEGEEGDNRAILDRGGVSVLERTQRLMSKYMMDFFDIYKKHEYKRVLTEIKKHVRRYSV